jgi:hypothetical protein
MKRMSFKLCVFKATKLKRDLICFKSIDNGIIFSPDCERSLHLAVGRSIDFTVKDRCGQNELCPNWTV